MSLIRQSTRVAARLAERGAPAAAGQPNVPGRKGFLGAPPEPAPINPWTGNYPYTHKELGGYNVYPGQGTYSWIEALKGHQPFIGHVFKNPCFYGGIHRRTIDVDKHFIAVDRYRCGIKWYDIMRLAWVKIHACRGWAYAVYINYWIIGYVISLWVRREPLELQVERNEFFMNYDSWVHGIEFDHHHFHHMLAHRRANKWGYENPDLEGH